MARSSSSGSRSSSSYSRPVPTRPIAPPPKPINDRNKPVQTAPPPSSTSTGSIPVSSTGSIPVSSGGFMSNVLYGISFGAGQSIAHNTVSRIFNWGLGSTHNSTLSGSSSIPNSTIISCEELNKQFKECLELNGNSYSTCKNAFEAYESCLKSQK